jgi:hypothetical protein
MASWLAALSRVCLRNQLALKTNPQSSLRDTAIFANNALSIPLIDMACCSTLAFQPNDQL